MIAFRYILLGALCGFAGVLNAAPIEIVKVEQDSSSSTKKGAAPAAKGAAAQAVAISQERVLNIYVRNGTQLPAKADVRFWAIGRDMKTGKLAPSGGGEKPVTLKPNATEMVESGEFTSEYKQRSTFVAVGAAKGAKTPAAAPGSNEASGTKVVGYGVQVIVDGKVVDERFSEGSYKKLVGGSDNGTPAPPFNKGAAPDSK